MKSPKEGSTRESISIMHRFHFTSALKRMAVTVKVRSLTPTLRAPQEISSALQRETRQPNITCRPRGLHMSRE